MSNISEEGISAVKQRACERLLAQRIEVKMKSLQSASGSSGSVMNRLHVAEPVARDDKTRPPVIPDSVLKSKSKGMDIDLKEKVAKFVDSDDEKPFYLRGFNSNEWKKNYKFKNDEWKFDIVPEIMDGKNIADFIDPEIMRRLEELEREEEERAANAGDQMDEDDEDLELDPEDMQKVKAIREKKKLIVQRHRMNKNTNKNNPIMQRRRDRTEEDVSTFESHLADLGIDPSTASERIRSRSTSRVGRKRSRSESAPVDAAALKKKRTASASRSLTPGVKNLEQKEKVAKLAKIMQRDRNKAAKKGEGDRVILDMKPKHLFSGKRGAGKTDRR